MSVCQSNSTRQAPHHNSGTPWIPELPIEHSMHQWTWHPMDRLWQVCKWYSLEANMLHYHTSSTSHHTDTRKWIGAHICKTPASTHTVDCTNLVAMLRWTGVLIWVLTKMHKHICTSPVFFFFFLLHMLIRLESLRKFADIIRSRKCNISALKKVVLQMCSWKLLKY